MIVMSKSVQELRGTPEASMRDETRRESYEPLCMQSNKSNEYVLITP